VQHFKRSAKILDSYWKIARNGPTCLHAQDWAKSLASSKHTMSHGLMNGSGTLICRREQMLQRCIGPLASFLKHLLQHGREYNKRVQQFCRGGKVYYRQTFF
jgi:hypothetical protein